MDTFPHLYGVHLGCFRPCIFSYSLQVYFKLVSWMFINFTFNFLYESWLGTYNSRNTGPSCWVSGPNVFGIPGWSAQHIGVRWYRYIIVWHFSDNFGAIIANDVVYKISFFYISIHFTVYLLNILLTFIQRVFTFIAFLTAMFAHNYLILFI